MRRIVRNIPFQINFKNFLALLKFDHKHSALTPHLKEKVEKLILTGNSLCEPKGVYSLHKIERFAEAEVVLENGMVLRGRAITKHCHGFSHVYLLAVTIGERLEEELEKLPPDEALILDAYGSEAAEAVAETLDASIRKEAIHFNLRRFNFRFSPGYSDFPLSTNLDFERFLKISDIGIKVTESYMLLPRKSITAVLPAAP